MVKTAKPSGQPTKARAAKPATPSDRITIDQLAEMFGLPEWDDVRELNADNLTDGIDWSDEDAALEAELAAANEIYARWYDAVRKVADVLFKAHGLELVDTVKVTKDFHRCVDLRVRPKATSDWKTAAEKLRQTINRVGYFYFSSLKEFLDSGPYTARRAVLTHLPYVRHYAEVFGVSSARTLYEVAWR